MDIIDIFLSTDNVRRAADRWGTSIETMRNAMRLFAQGPARSGAFDYWPGTSAAAYVRQTNTMFDSFFASRAWAEDASRASDKPLTAREIAQARGPRMQSLRDEFAAITPSDAARVAHFDRLARNPISVPRGVAREDRDEPDMPEIVLAENDWRSRDEAARNVERDGYNAHLDDLERELRMINGSDTPTRPVGDIPVRIIVSQKINGNRGVAAGQGSYKMAREVIRDGMYGDSRVGMLTSRR